MKNAHKEYKTIFERIFKENSTNKIYFEGRKKINIEFQK